MSLNFKKEERNDIIETFPTFFKKGQPNALWGTMAFTSGKEKTGKRKRKEKKYVVLDWLYGTIVNCSMNFKMNLFSFCNLD